MVERLAVLEEDWRTAPGNWTRVSRAARTTLAERGNALGDREGVPADGVDDQLHLDSSAAQELLTALAVGEPLRNAACKARLTSSSMRRSATPSEHTATRKRLVRATARLTR
jgi:hypothetical protein